MSPQSIFITASLIVVLSLLFALTFWALMVRRTSGSARIAAVLFTFCFFLYAIGQSIVIFQVLQWIHLAQDISSYLYASAAIIFAVGSYYQYQSLR